MPRTIKTTLQIIGRRLQVMQIRNRIRKMENCAYLNLEERICLKQSIDLLKELEQKEIYSTNIFALH